MSALYANSSYMGLIAQAPTALRNTTNTQHATPASDMKFQPFEGGLQLFVPR